MQTQTVKEKITKVVLSQPEDAAHDEIHRKIGRNLVVLQKASHAAEKRGSRENHGLFKWTVL